jgi:hypothetical protein
MPPPKFPSTLRLLRGFVVGGGYLALVAATLAGVTEQPYLPCLGMVLLTGLTLFVLALMLAGRWAFREQGGRWQLDLASAFLLVTMVAICLAAMRWLAQNTWLRGTSWSLESWTQTTIWSACLLVLCVPFVLLLGDAILALAAWFVWRPCVRACLRRWFSR